MTTRGTTGLVLGKFLPPHRGHQYLVDFARHYADHVTVHVCSIASEPIPGALRYAWMREQFAGCANVTVVHNDDPNPHAPEECPERFYDIWRESLLRHMRGRAPDFVFASEPYGFPLAECLRARYVPVDHARDHMPVSGTLLRSDPLRYWEYLIPPARPYFAKRVALVGPESSGKSTLTARLAQHFQTVHAAEYGRTYLEAVPAHWLGADGANGFTEEALLTILRGHRASVEALARRCNRVLFSDTEAVVTACWSRVLLGYVPPLVEEYIRAKRYDLYLLCAATQEWADDSSRVQPDYAERKRFEESVIAYLDAHRLPYVRLVGGWEERERWAVEAVEGLLRPNPRPLP